MAGEMTIAVRALPQSGASVWSRLVAATRAVYVSPNQPWALSPNQEARIAHIFALEMPAPLRFAKAGVALTYARLGALAHPEARTLTHGVGALFRNPPSLHGHFLKTGNEVSHLARQFVERTTGGRVDALPTVGEYTSQRRALALARPHADRWAAEADIRTYHALRCVDGWGGSFYDLNADAVFIHPGHHTADRHGCTSAAVRCHEAEHRTGLRAGSVMRRHAGWVASAKVFLSWFDPLTPLWRRWGLYHEECHATGAEWELLHRTPAALRASVMDELRTSWEDSSGLDASWLDRPRAEVRRVLRARRDQYDHETRIRLATIFGSYRSLSYAPLSKADYLRRIHRDGHYSWWNIAWNMATLNPLAFAWREDVFAGYLAEKALYLAKLSAWIYALS